MRVDVDRLKELRVEKMLSQQELAEKSGVARDTISKLERGASKSARYSTIHKLAAALGVPYRELMK
jgi:transcriptional regulator with XRE-family HTH domain